MKLLCKLFGHKPVFLFNFTTHGPNPRDAWYQCKRCKDFSIGIPRDKNGNAIKFKKEK